MDIGQNMGQIVVKMKISVSICWSEYIRVGKNIGRENVSVSAGSVSVQPYNQHSYLACFACTHEILVIRLLRRGESNRSVWKTQVNL
jgi:hypothetical protein